MKLSEKYFNKMQPQCMECGGNFSNEQVKRYGEYCKLESTEYEGETHRQAATRVILKQMAREDKLK